MGNCSPKKQPKWETATFTYQQCPCPEEGPCPSITLEFEYIERYRYEVRPPNAAKKLIVNGSKQEKLKKTVIQIPDLVNGENSSGEVVNFIDQVFYQPEYEIIGSGDDIKSRPVFERYCKADIVYDDQYFYHIFEWPLSHNIEPRPVGGITVIPAPPPPPGSEGGGTSCPTYQVESTTVGGTVTLNRVDSQVLGVPENTIVYHGGTNDNKIFFYYENTSDKNYIAVGDRINGWTVNRVVNYNSEHFNQKSIRTTESVRRRVSKFSENKKTPGYIFINKNDDSTDRIINIGDRVIGNGIQQDTFVEGIQGLKIFLSKPLKYQKKKDVRNVRFEKTDLVNNISNKILCYAEISGGSANFVKDNFYSRNSSSTPQYTSTTYHVFDDKKNKNIQLTTTKEITVDMKSMNDDGGSSDDTDNRKHYVVTFLDETELSSKNDIQITITDDQTASGVEKSFNFVSKIELVNSKKFKVWFKRKDTGNNTFVRGWSITRNPGGSVIGENRIQVVAGKGIIDRSAVCGVYVSNDKKYFTYTPLFYGKDSFCESTNLSDDELGNFTLGNVILNDNTTYISQEFLCVSPLTDDLYRINSIFWTYFNRPASYNELKSWNEKYKLAYAENPSPSVYLELQKEIIDYENTKLEGKTVRFVKDAECDNTITPEYEKVYYPYVELKDFEDKFEPVTELPSYDPCVGEKTPAAYSTDEIKKIIETNLSSVNLPQEMYKRIIEDNDSLQNTLFNAVDKIKSSIPDKTTIPNIPPQIEGENKSSKVFSTEYAHRIPPRFKSLEYVIDDFRFIDDSGLISDSEVNNIKIQIKSIPRWTGSLSPSSGSGWTSTVNTSSEGFVNSITISAAPFAPLIPGFPPLIPPVTKSWVSGPHPATFWHGDDINYQVTFQKILNFRVNEVSKILANCAKNKGNPYMDNPPYAKITKSIESGDTTINVDSTSQFVSSGYLIIPKFIVKKEVNPETQNETLKHYYLGEEIIYYKNKTGTQFLNCTREMFDSSNDFEEFINSGFIETGVTYIIKTLGTVDWKSYGAPDSYSVGTIFTATSDGSDVNESGEVYLFETTLTPFDGNTFVIHSYEKNNYLSQYWPIQIQNK